MFIDFTVENKVFDGVFLFAATSDTRHFVTNAGDATLQIGGDATENFPDDEPIPGLKNGMKGYMGLNTPKPIVTADGDKERGNERWSCLVSSSSETRKETHF